MKRLEQYRKNMAAWQYRTQANESDRKNRLRVKVVLLVVALAIFACVLIATAAGAGERKARWLRVEATAYCGGPCSTCQTTGVTSTGRDASRRGVAVDPSVIALGARLDIPGVGVWIKADDVGGAIKGARIDIRMSHGQAVAWGRRSIVVRVWE